MTSELMLITENNWIKRIGKEKKNGKVVEFLVSFKRSVLKSKSLHKKRFCKVFVLPSALEFEVSPQFKQKKNFLDLGHQKIARSGKSLKFHLPRILMLFFFVN